MKHQIMTYYFIGIGGVGMSALARLCLNQGNKVFINSPYGKLESVVVELPFWDPKKQIPIGKT